MKRLQRGVCQCNEASFGLQQALSVRGEVLKGHSCTADVEHTATRRMHNKSPPEPTCPRMCARRTHSHAIDNGHNYSYDTHHPSSLLVLCNIYGHACMHCHPSIHPSINASLRPSMHACKYIYTSTCVHTYIHMYKHA